eukprot:gnl/TRDRNA2_/TRDRNA2_30878_c0_seq1.p1 gnl/TRDRNA2_/TRDRNA2_30878_c0~~gnl/TRDRNA2_/TRDRNA2_30878_c0_seq1.p1  ORF type:complete len:456 (+),score=77.46 gnl/TRDRNA2_/TRDRNA2_30878_c0_seq1:88-1368(+)
MAGAASSSEDATASSYPPERMVPSHIDHNPPPSPEEDAYPKCCRFCFDESIEEELISPCACRGTEKYVHPSCLRRWQSEVSDERRRTCQVCQTMFSVAPPPLPEVPPQRHLSVRRTPFGSLIEREDAGASPRRAPLFGDVHTNPHYDREAGRRLPDRLRSLMLNRMKPGCLVLQTPRRAEMEIPRPPRSRRADDGMMALFEIVVLARMAHWHKGIFLMGFQAPGEGSDGSDALIGVNLAGQAVPTDDARGHEQLQGLPLEGPVKVLRGGPVRPEHALGLIAFEGQPSPDALSSASFVRSMPLDDEECGGGALFGELRDVTAVLRRQPHLRLKGALIFHGHAVWSSLQLLSEVARGSWGLCSSRWADLLPSAEDPQERWGGIWEGRELLFWLPEETAGGASGNASTRGGWGSASSSRPTTCRSCTVM